MSHHHCSNPNRRHYCVSLATTPLIGHRASLTAPCLPRRTRTSLATHYTTTLTRRALFGHRASLAAPMLIVPISTTAGGSSTDLAIVFLDSDDHTHPSLASGAAHR